MKKFIKTYRSRHTTFYLVMFLQILLSSLCLAEEIKVGPDNENSFSIWVRESSLSSGAYKLNISFPLQYKRVDFYSATLIMNDIQGRSVLLVPVKVTKTGVCFSSEVRLPQDLEKVFFEIKYGKNDSVVFVLSVQISQYMNKRKFQSKLNAIQKSPIRSEPAFYSIFQHARDSLEKNDWEDASDWIEYLLDMKANQNKECHDALEDLYARSSQYIKTKTSMQPKKIYLGGKSPAVESINKAIEGFNEKQRNSAYIEPLHRRAARVGYSPAINKAVVFDLRGEVLTVIKKQSDGRFKGRVFANAVTPEGMPGLTFFDIYIDKNILKSEETKNWNEKRGQVQ